MINHESAPFSDAFVLRTMRTAVVAVILVAVACTASEYVVDYGIEPAGRARLDGAEAPGRWQPFIFEGANEIPSARYEDEALRVDLTVFSFGVTLTVSNRSQRPLGVIWSESRIEGTFDAPLVLGEPGTPEERQIPQQTTTIPPGEVSTYGAMAGPPGEWQPFTDEPDRGFWQRERSLFDVDVDGIAADDRQATAARVVGSEIDVVLMLESEGERRRLVLPARVVDATVRAAYY